MSAGPDARLLDNPVRSSLLGPHARFAQRHGGVLRYLPPVSPFAALPDQPGDRDWADAAALAGPGGLVALAGVAMPPPPGWKVVLSIPCVQMLDAEAAAAPDEEAVRLGAPDVAQMLGLVARTEPGPFLARTIEMGTYRASGAAVPSSRWPASGCTHRAGRRSARSAPTMPTAAAGSAPGWSWPWQPGIRARGQTPFLHVAASNVTAIGLYESLGFQFRRHMLFSAARAPLTRLAEKGPEGPAHRQDKTGRGAPGRLSCDD